MHSERKKLEVYLILISTLVLTVQARRVSIIQAYGIGEPTVINDKMTSRPSLEEYAQLRSRFLTRERARSIGADVTLNDREQLANDIIMTAKREEFEKGLNDPHSFAPSRHLFEVLDQIKSSKLFKLIKKMPKGGVLHAHDTALCSTDFIVELTYRPNLWLCYDEKTDFITFRFSRQQPEPLKRCQWSLVAKVRAREGKEKFDKKLRKHFSLYTENPLEEYKDINQVWNRFVRIFATLSPLATYAPVWKDYYKRALEEFYADGVQYLEFRGVLPELYDLDGRNYTKMDTTQMYVDVLNQFKKEHPGFIGSKFIFGPSRSVDNTTFSDYMSTIIELKKRFPNFVAGFDLVGQEDLGKPLIDFVESLLTLPNDINFFFHAAETNWFGSSTDENLIDAILLGTKRIGHGYGVIKHPMVLEALKEHDIAIEVNPISNQVLKLNDDNRNHPCAHLFADNFPVVVSSDDPSFWEATPLSHDFYIAFLGIASAHSDLRVLKQLAVNSIAYSSLNSAEKEVAFSKWQSQWHEYIEWVIRENKRPNSYINEIE